MAQALDSFLTYTTGGSAHWQPKPGTTEDYAQSGTIGDNQESWLQTTVSGAGTLSFQWTVSSQEDYDYLEFYIDTVRQDRISGEVESQQKSYTISGTGTHTLKWRYVKDSSDSAGYDCGHVDHVVWTGVIPDDPPTDAWLKTLTYVYDAFGRRIEKKYDDLTVLKYVYDGAHCIAEYDAYNHVRRKYIYGPGVDQPISMIESSGTYAGTYYYHFDGLGSVTALTNSSGTTVAVYEYDVYGRPGASVPAHPNRILFTGREYDQETGLYYYRARYYNPQIGRFLQTDPVGYGAGLNLYRYCLNRPTALHDPSGLDPTPISIAFYDSRDENGDGVALYRT